MKNALVHIYNVNTFTWKYFQFWYIYINICWLKHGLVLIQLSKEGPEYKANFSFKKILNLFFTNIKCHSKFPPKQDPVRKVWTDPCICWLHAANELWSNSNGRCCIYKLWPEKFFCSCLHLLLSSVLYIFSIYELILEIPGHLLLRLIILFQSQSIPNLLCGLIILPYLYELDYMHTSKLHIRCISLGNQIRFSFVLIGLSGFRIA